MGLDGLDLVMRVEKRFDISIRDEMYESVRTVGDLRDLVLSQLAAKSDWNTESDRSCPTSRAFLHLRQTVQTVWPDIKRESVRPSTTLGMLFPHLTRRRDWRRLQKEFNLYLPDLGLPPIFRKLVTAAVPLFLVVSFFSSVALTNLPSEALLLMICEGIAFALALATAYLLTRPFAVRFPAELATVGDVARLAFRCRPWHYDGSRDAATSVGNQAVWDTLVEIVSDIGSVEPDQIHPESRFIEDLRFD